MKLLEGIKEKVAVELGVWRGDFSQEIFLQQPIKLYLIDPWIQQSKEVYNDILNLDNTTNEKNYNFVVDRFKDAPNVEILRQFGHQVVRNINIIDYIYIDANHSYESALMDLSMWYPLISKGGVITGHDYSWVSVRKALDTFCKITNLKYYPVERDSWRIDL